MNSLRAVRSVRGRAVRAAPPELGSGLRWHALTPSPTLLRSAGPGGRGSVRAGATLGRSSTRAPLVRDSALQVSPAERISVGRDQIEWRDRELPERSLAGIVMSPICVQSLQVRHQDVTEALQAARHRASRTVGERSRSNPRIHRPRYTSDSYLLCVCFVLQAPPPSPTSWARPLLTNVPPPVHADVTRVQRRWATSHQPARTARSFKPSGALAEPPITPVRTVPPPYRSGWHSRR